jgi:hypothetical protein
MMVTEVVERTIFHIVTPRGRGRGQRTEVADTIFGIATPRTVVIGGKGRGQLEF